MTNPASLFLLLPALIAGAVVPFQAGANATLGRLLGHPLWATLVSLAVSIAVILPVMAAFRVPIPTIDAASKGPWWIWTGGLAGVIYITAALLLAPRLGAANFMVAVIAGQMIASRAGSRGVSEAAYMAGNLLGQEVTAQDVAQAFVFTALMAKTTGAVITVDGGNVAAMMR